MGRLNHLAVLIGFAAAFCWAMAAVTIAQSASLPAETPTHQTIPEAGGPGGSGSSTEPLSEKLDRQNGVIKPPAGIDAGLTQPPPAAGNTPVIAPPGTRRGDRDLTPKP